MNLGWICALSMSLAFNTAHSQEKPIEGRIAVKNSGVERLMTTLRSSVNPLPQGIQSLDADPIAHVLVVKGSSGAIKELEEIVRLLDVSPKRLRMKARLFRIRDERGRRTNELMSEMVSVTSNNSPMSMSVGDETWDQTATVLPRLNGDSSITLQVSFAFAVNGEVKKRPDPFTRRVQVGNTFAAIYTDSDSPIAKTGDLTGFEARFSPGRPQYRIEVQVTDVVAP